MIGAIAAGEVPAEGNGDPTGSWIGLLPLTVGALFVAAGAYLAAVFLIHDARSSGEDENARALRALGARRRRRRPEPSRSSAPSP